jgi:hypothetical protein
MPPRRGLRIGFGFGCYNDAAPTALRRRRILPRHLNSCDPSQSPPAYI